MSKLICASEANIEFLRNTPKIYFVAMKEELDASATSSPVIYTGTGKARSGRGLLNYIKDNWDSVRSGNAPMIVSLGTAGSGKHHRSDIVLCETFVNNGDSFLIEKLSFNTFPVHESHICASSDFFISEKLFPVQEIERMRGEYDCLDMESFELASICSVFGLRFCAVKCISDGCDDTVANFDAELPKFRAVLNDFVKSLE